jgi:exonuclease SbcD
VKFIHSADWHIGRTLNSASLLEDQAWWLERFVALVDAEKPDAVVIAGDVYDRAVPPADAVALLDATLTRIVRGLGVPVLLVAGNHDSPDRVGFGANVLDAAGLHVAGRLGTEVRSVVIGEGADATRFWLLPYADPIETRDALGEAAAGVHDHEAAVALCVDAMRGVGACEPRQVLVTHHFVAGGLTSESERGLTVGGTGAVPAALFDGFDFVALGHLHRPQLLGEGRIHYSGSALKYSFDEAAGVKSVSVVTLGDGAPEIRRVELGALRDVRRIEGSYDDILAAAPTDPGADDYVEIILDEKVMPPDALGRLREYYPNLSRLQRAVEYVDDADDGRLAATDSIEALADDELFARFFKYATGEELEGEELATLHELLGQRERGAAR